MTVKDSPTVIAQSKVYHNYRVSIYEIRERLNVKEGERVVFVSEGDRVYIKKMEA